MESASRSGYPEILPLPLYRASTLQPPSRGSRGSTSPSSMMPLRPAPFDVQERRDTSGGLAPPSSFKLVSRKEDTESLEMQEQARTSLLVESLGIPSARPSIETPRPSVDSQPSQPKTPKPWWMSKEQTLPIRERAQAVLDRRFPSYHYTVPRLFIALPDDPMTTPRPDTDDLQRLQRFRLYFLCECGVGWTRPLGSGLNHVHIGRHGGYPIAPDRQEAFFRENGPMILALLLYLWHGNIDSAAVQRGSFGNRPSTQHRRSHSAGLDAIISMSGLAKESEQHQAKKHPTRPSNSARNLVAALPELQSIDLPKPIQQDVQHRFRTMIEFLIGLNPALYQPFHQEPSLQPLTSDAHGRSASTGNASTTTTDPEKAPPGPTTASANVTTSTTMWSYPASLSDLRRLYGYLGLHSPQARQEQGAMGDLFRVTSLQGDATWICASHYRWTFYNAEIDNFFHWVESRGGTTDKQSGSVLMTIVSGDQLLRLCDWIVAKSGAALIELHLKLQWRFTRKDLWNLARAVAKTNINMMTLNGCMHQEDSGFKILNKRHDPILRMMEESRLQCLEISHFPNLFRRLSNIHFDAPMMERLVFGPATTSMDKCDLSSLASVVASCPNLRELLVPGLIQTESHANRLVDGLVTRPLREHLSMLDLSRSGMNDGVAYKLAVGLDVTQIQHLNVSYNPLLSDRACARLIDGMRWRLASLGMAQTGFGNRAMAALISYLEGSDDSSAHDGAAHHHDPTRSNHHDSNKAHPPCPLVSLDIANNQCSLRSFQALARVRRQPYQREQGRPSSPAWVALDLSLSSNLTDAECSQIVEKFVSPEVVKLRLGFCNVGDLTVKALARVLLSLPFYAVCRLEELEIQGSCLTVAGIASLARALKEVTAWTCLQSLNLSHGAELDDTMAYSVLRSLIEAEQPELANTVGTATGAGPLVVVTNPQQQHSLAACGFFSMMTELNLSSTKIGDETGKCIARALVQSWVALETLTILEPEGMTDLGMAMILEALTANTTVVELGIGRSGAASVSGNSVLSTVVSPTTASMPTEAAVTAATAASGATATVDPMNQVDLFGTALLRLLEMNKRICTLTTIGAPMQAIAKGLLLNKTLVSLYLIKTRGTHEDLEAMGEAIAYNRSLLVLWMGGSDESLLRPLVPADTRDTASGSGGSGGHAVSRFGRGWHEDSLQHDGLQNATTTRSGRWLEGSLSHRRSRSAHPLSFSGMFSKPHRAAHSDNETTFHKSNNHYNTTRKYPHGWGGVPPGGSAMTVIRNPLFDGIRRNHRLIKIRLDPVPTPLGSPMLSRDMSGAGFTIPMPRAATTQSVTFSHHNTMTTRSASMAAAGVGQGGGEGLHANRIGPSPPASPASHPAPSSSPRPSPSQLRSSMSHPSLAAMMDQVLQQERVIQQQLAKKMAANRAALREHGRIGAEELRLLRVDDDIIREVCNEGFL